MQNIQRIFHIFVLGFCLYGLTYASVHSPMERYMHELEKDLMGTQIVVDARSIAAFQMYDKFLTLRRRLDFSCLDGLNNAWHTCCAANQAIIAVAYDQALNIATPVEVFKKTLQALQGYSNLQELFVALSAFYQGEDNIYMQTVREACADYEKHLAVGVGRGKRRLFPVWLPHWVMGRVYGLDALKELGDNEPKVESFFDKVLQRPYADDHITPQDCKPFAFQVAKCCSEQRLILRSYVPCRPTQAFLSKFILFVERLGHCRSSGDVTVDPLVNPCQEQNAISLNLLKLLLGVTDVWPACRTQGTSTAVARDLSQPASSGEVAVSEPPHRTPFQHYLFVYLLPSILSLTPTFDAVATFVHHAEAQISLRVKEFLCKKQYNTVLEELMHLVEDTGPVKISALLNAYQRATSVASYVVCEVLYSLAQNPHISTFTLSRFMAICAPEEISVVSDMLVDSYTQGALHLKKHIEESMDAEKLEPWRRYARTRCRWFFVKLGQKLFDKTLLVLSSKIEE